MDEPIKLLPGQALSRSGRPRLDYLADHGRPIRYGYLSGSWPLRDLQNVYADQPGSAEMASAGRPFSARLLIRLMARGVVVVEVNPEPTPLSSSATITVRESASTALPTLLQRLPALLN